MKPLPLLAAIISPAFIFLAPLAAHAASPPALLRFTAPMPGMNSYVYWYDPNGNRYVFLTEKAVWSWFSDASSRIRNATVAELAPIPLHGTIAHKPGAKLLKFASNPRVYTVSRYSILRWLTTENVAVALYGPDWKSKVDEVSVADYPVYRFGSPITDEAEYDLTDNLSVTSPSQNIPMTKVPEKFEANVSLTGDRSSAIVGQTITLTATVSNPRTSWQNLVIRFYDSAGQVLKTCKGTVGCAHTVDVTGPLGNQTFGARVFNEFEQAVESIPVTVFVANPL